MGKDQGKGTLPKREPVPRDDDEGANEKFDDARERFEEISINGDAIEVGPINELSRKKEGFAKFQEKVLQPIVRGFESRPGTIVIVLLTILDGILGQVQLMLSLYDPAFPNPLASNVNAAATLGASGDEQWGIVRKFFFGFSLGIRCLFLIEITIRLLATNATQYLKNPYHVLDVIVVIAAFILKPSLSARDSIITSPIILLRLWHLGTVIRSGKEKELEDFKRMVEEERKVHQAALANQRTLVKATQKQLDIAHNKLKLLLGEETFQSEVGNPGKREMENPSRSPSDTAANLILSTMKV
ncbi:hypothetical protein HDU97_003918 [Phlyctochytrium planicorne]|nr:hypothetical protein HDU97_003918 [Phlyctochytrium planicorne]